MMRSKGVFSQTHFGDMCLPALAGATVYAWFCESWGWTLRGLLVDNGRAGGARNRLQLCAGPPILGHHVTH
jgi:hypothetical protein